MKIKDSKFFKGALSLGVGAILLTTAVFANYDSANGYSVCKEALKKIAFSQNFSADVTATAMIDNTELTKMSTAYKLNAGGNPSQSTESSESYNDIDGHRVYFNRNVTQDDYRVHMSRYSDEPEDNYGYISGPYNNDGPIVNGFNGDPETGAKVINFAETIADTLIGDIKNSFVLTSKENGISVYNVNLSTEQMPSYVTAGVSMMSSIIRNEVSHSSSSLDPEALLFSSGDPYIRDVGATISVDSDGNLIQIKGIANFVGYDNDGNEHIFSIDLNMDFYDYGTTEIERIPDDVLETLDDHRFYDDIYELDEEALEAEETDEVYDK